MSCCSRRSRGVGAILAAVFMLLILVLGFSVFMVIQAQMGEFQESVETMNTLDWERGQESGFINDILSNVITDDPLDSDYLKLNLTVTNDGFIGFRLVFMEIFNLTDSDYIYLEVNDPVTVNPGETVSNIKSSKPLASDYATKSFLIGLVTERGNTILVGLEGGVFGAPGGGTGTGFGLPFTLLLDASALRYTGTFPGSDPENRFYLYGTNLSNETMTGIIFHLIVDVEDQSVCGGACMIFTANTTALIKIVSDGTIYTASLIADAGNNATHREWTVSAPAPISTLQKDETYYLEIRGEMDSATTAEWIRVILQATGFTAGGDPISINVASFVVYRD